MGTSEERIIAVIMVGGPTKGTRFRPLSLNVPKSLFPLAGQPMVHHPISACQGIPNLAHIYLIGFYEEREFTFYVPTLSNELRIYVRYLREDRPHGSAGGLYLFRDYIMEDSPSLIFLLNCNICYSFPLPCYSFPLPGMLVKALEAIVSKGQKVVEEDVIQLIELLMLQLVKLDGIAFDDDFLNFDDDFLSSFLDTPLDISAFTSNRTPVEQSVHASPKSPTSIIVAAQAYSHVLLPLRSCLVMSSLWEIAAAATTTAQIIALELQHQ